MHLKLSALLSKCRVSTQYLQVNSRNLTANYKGMKEKSGTRMAHFASDGCNLLESPGAIWDCAVFEKHEEAGPLAAMEKSLE